MRNLGHDYALRGGVLNRKLASKGRLKRARAKFARLARLRTRGPRRAKKRPPPLQGVTRVGIAPMISFVVETRTPPQAVQRSLETMVRESVGAPRGAGRDAAPTILGIKRLGHDVEMLTARPLQRYAKEWWLWATREHQPMAARPALVPLTNLLRACEAAAAEYAGLARRTIASANPITYELRAMLAWSHGSGRRRAP